MQESIAVTQNYVSSANLQHVLDFLKGGKAELVSGCPVEERCRLHDAFLEALQQQRPQVISPCLFSSFSFSNLHLLHLSLAPESGYCMAYLK